MPRPTVRRLGVAVLALSALCPLFIGCSSTPATGSSTTGGGTTAPSQTIAPSITTQPAAQSAVVGNTATFSVVAAGTAPLTYEWRRGGTTISGATSATYTTGVLTLADDGANFTIVVSNSAGSALSNAARLTVSTAPPTITASPTGVTRFRGESATFTVSAKGDSLTYQWRANGSNIGGATAATYTTPVLTSANDNTSYDVVVTNTAGSVTSSAAVLRVGPLPYTYTTQKGAKLNLYAWPGTKNALLTSSASLDPALIRKYLASLDGTWSYYAKTVGKEPTLYFNYNGLATVAEVPSSADTCGAGCTYIGATGIEIADPYFNWMLYSIPNNSYDQIPFYEFGRSFWLFPQLNFSSGYGNGCLNTGFAVLMRLRSLQALGYQGSFNSFATSASDTANVARGVANYNSLISVNEKLIDSYAADSSLTFENTFLLDKYNNPNGSCADLFSSLVRRLARDNGDEAFVQALWKEVLKRPISAGTQDAADNFMLAASAAANRNLTSVFHDQWRWPISVSASNEAFSRWGKP